MREEPIGGVREEPLNRYLSPLFNINYLASLNMLQMIRFYIWFNPFI